MRKILDSEQIDKTLENITKLIASDIPLDLDIVVIGIRSRCEVLAKRLSDRLSDKLRKEILCGTLDITLYRDDLNNPQGNSQPRVHRRHYYPCQQG